MQRKDTQEYILEVASGLFALKGYSSVSMRNVASAVGVTVANLYYHFRDKEELIRASLSHVFSEKMASHRGFMEHYTTPDDRLEAFVSWFVRLIFGEELFTRLILREFLDGTKERLEYMTTTVFKETFEVLAGLIAECAETPDPVMTAASVVSLVIGNYQVARVLPYLAEGRLEDYTIDTVTRHILAIIRATFPPCKNTGKV